MRGQPRRHPHDVQPVPRALLAKLRGNLRRREKARELADEAAGAMVALLREVRAGGFNMQQAADAAGLTRTYAWQITQHEEGNTDG